MIPNVIPVTLISVLIKDIKIPIIILIREVIIKQIRRRKKLIRVEKMIETQIVRGKKKSDGRIN